MDADLRDPNTSNQECASWEGDIKGVLSSSWLRDPGDCVGFSELSGDIRNPMPVSCYDFEAAWTFHQQLQCIVFRVL